MEQDPSILGTEENVAKVAKSEVVLLVLLFLSPSNCKFSGVEYDKWMDAACFCESTSATKEFTS